jgi:hypothetical protein
MLYSFGGHLPLGVFTFVATHAFLSFFALREDRTLPLIGFAEN